MSDSEESCELPSERLQEIRALNKDFSAYTSDGNFCVYFKLVKTRRDIEEDIKKDTFFPDFVHQFFVDQERIFGFSNPILRLFYTASSLKRYIKFDYQDKVTKERDGIEPDDIMKLLQPILYDTEYTESLDQFISETESDNERNFRPPGELLYEFEVDYRQPIMLSRAQLEQKEQLSHANGNEDLNGTSSCSSNREKKTFQIYKAHKDNKNFDTFERRMQTFVMWFIDAANMIDVNDPHWDIFMVFEKFNPSTSQDSAATSVSTEDRYYFVGYSTVYRYYAYPDKNRPRISQMLLLPPYRRNSIGTNLLQSIYNWYINQSETLDITAEDPAEEFIAMRDYLDCKNCATLPTFKVANLMEGFSKEMSDEARKKLKICPRQARKVYEILKLKNLDTTNQEEYRKFRLEIKNRLNGPNQRLKLDCQKLIKKGYELPEEMKLRRDNFRFAALEENFLELEKQYKKTIAKLEK